MDELTRTNLARSTPLTPSAEGPKPHDHASTQAIEEDWSRVRALALKQLDRFMSFEPEVLKGDDPDAIHDMRVASRRLQQVLDLIYSKPQPKAIRQLRKQIRRCRGSLGGVRNCDVLLDRVDRVLSRKRAAHREAWKAVHDYLAGYRSKTFAKALRKLSKVNLAVFYVHLKDCLAHSAPEAFPNPLTHGDPSPEAPVIEPFPERVGEALEKVWTAFQDQLAESQHDPRPAVFHGARIATKRLRYLLEVVHEFDVAGSAEPLVWLRKLQRHLGDWHDLEVLEQMMIEMVARPDFLRQHLPLALEVERLILRNRAVKKGYEEKYFRLTRDTPEMQRVKDWVDYLLASPSAAFARA